MPTSHVDLVPTLLSAAGLDERDLAERLRPSFSELHALPGRDLMPHVRGDRPPDARRAVYSMTRDDVLEGSEPRSLMWRRFRTGNLATWIREPLQVGSAFEALVARVADDEARGGAGHLWKLVRSFDDPATWTEPGRRQRLTRERGASFREEPLPDEWELYDLDVDPIEAHNAVRTHAPVFEHLRRRLQNERTAVVPPRNRPWPYASEPDAPPSRFGRLVAGRLGRR